MLHDEELEKAMLFYLVFEQEDYLLNEDDFVIERNKKVIKAINELKAKKEEISILSIKSKIKANQKQVLDYLTTLGEYVSLTSPDTVYNNLIKLSKKRKIIKELQEKTIKVAECEDIDILAQELIGNINKIEQIDKKEKTLSEQIIETINQIEKNASEKKDYSLYTGIRELDDIICGLHNEELTIIGARPRSRKNNISFTNRNMYSK